MPDPVSTPLAAGGDDPLEGMSPEQIAAAYEQYQASKQPKAPAAPPAPAEGMGAFLWRKTKDTGSGILSAPKNIATGLYDGIISGPAGFGHDLYNANYQRVNDLFGIDTFEEDTTSFGSGGDVGEPGFVHDTTKFITGLLGVAKGAKMARLVPSVSSGSKVAQVAMAGTNLALASGATSFIQDNRTERLSSFLNSKPWLAPVTSDWLAGDPNDAPLNARLRNAAETLALTPLGDAVFRSSMVGFRAMARMKSGMPPVTDPLEKIPGIEKAKTPDEINQIVDDHVDYLKTQHPATGADDRVTYGQTKPAEVPPPADPVAPPVAPVAPPVAPTMDIGSYALPAALSKIAPRYSYGPKQFTVSFANDFDKAAYTVANTKTKSAKHDAIMASLKEQTGLSDEAILAHGAAVKAALKEQAKGAPAGALKATAVAFKGAPEIPKGAPEIPKGAPATPTAPGSAPSGSPPPAGAVDAPVGSGANGTILASRAAPTEATKATTLSDVALAVAGAKPVTPFSRYLDGSMSFEDAMNEHVQHIASSNINKQAGGRALPVQSVEDYQRLSVELAGTVSKEDAVAYAVATGKTLEQSAVMLGSVTALSNRAGVELLALKGRNATGAELMDAADKALRISREYSVGKGGLGRGLRMQQEAVGLPKTKTNTNNPNPPEPAKDPNNPNPPEPAKDPNKPKPPEPAPPTSAEFKAQATDLAKDPNTDPELLKKLIQNANSVDPHEMFRLTVAAKEAMDAIPAATPGRTRKILMYVAANRLSGITTQGMAFVNGIVQGMVLAPTQKLIGGGKAEAAGYMTGLYESHRGALEHYVQTWKTGVGTFDGVGQATGHWQLPTKGIAGGMMWPLRSLQATDQGIKFMVYKANVRANAIRDGMNNGLKDDALMRYVKAADEVAILPDGSLTDGHALLMAKRATASEPPRESFTEGVGEFLKLNPIMEIFIPFLNAGSSAMHLALENTPLTQMLYPTFRKRLIAREPQALGQVATGITVTGLAYQLASSGILRGSGPSDPILKRKWDEGGPSNSIKIGGQWVSTRWFAPLDVALNAMADLMQAPEEIRNAKEGIDTAFKVSAYVIKGIEAKSMIQPVVRLSGAINKPDTFLADYAGQMASSFVPQSALVAQVDRIVNGITHDGTPVKEEANGFVEQIQRGLPWMDLPPKYNSIGEPIPIGWTSLVQAYKEDKVIAELGSFTTDLKVGVHLIGDGKVDMRRFTTKDGTNAWQRFNDLIRDSDLRKNLKVIISSPEYAAKPSGDDGFGKNTASTKVGSIALELEKAKNAIMARVTQESPALANALSAVRGGQAATKAGSQQGVDIAKDILKTAK